jgi:excisionase family DNA binding protein
VAEARIADAAAHAALKEPLITTAALAQTLSCHAATLRKWTRTGCLPSVRIGSSLRFRKGTLKAQFGGDEPTEAEMRAACRTLEA